MSSLSKILSKMALLFGAALLFFWLAFKTMFKNGEPPLKCMPTPTGENICFKFSSLVLLGFMALSVMVYFMAKLENRKK